MVSKLAKNIAHFFVVQKIVEKPKEAIYTYGTMKKATKFKRILSGVLSAVMAVSAVPIVSAQAEESSEPYPYTMFAASSDDGAITVNAGNFCINGNVATNGTIVSSGNVNVNGTKTESAEESMIFIFDSWTYRRAV